MPHCKLEYSGNLDAIVDIGQLCGLIADDMAACTLFELGGIRVRAIPCHHYTIADAHPDNGFIDISLRIGAGRSAADKKAFGDRLFANIADHLGALFDAPHFALSLDVSELDPILSWKKNSIHPRLRHSLPE